MWVMLCMDKKINVTEGNNNVGSIVLEETTQELQNVVVQGKIVHVRTQPDGVLCRCERYTRTS